MGDMNAYECAALRGDADEEAIGQARDILRMEDGHLSKGVRILNRGVMIGCTYVTRDAVRDLIRKLREV